MKAATRRYVIIEAEDTDAGFEGLGKPKSFRGPADFEGGVRVEADDLSPRDASLIRKDKRRRIAPAMPIKLIKPLGEAQQFDVNAHATSPALETIGDKKHAWGVTAVEAHRSDYRGSGVTVAVLDTGIAPDHPAFDGVELIRRNFTDEADPDDLNGHGTHCAGTIFGRDVDDIRIGVAPGVNQAYIGKVLDSSGGGTTESILKGLRWVVNEGVDVISMSLGFDFPGQVAYDTQYNGVPEKEAFSRALNDFAANLLAFQAIMMNVQARKHIDEGSVIIAAAGNENSPDVLIETSIPASVDGILSVGALARAGDNTLTVADFSNLGPRLSAPGVDILSASHLGGLTTMNGTSMACPHVAGVAALYWDVVKNSAYRQTAVNVESHLISGVDTKSFAAGVEITGRGNGLVKAP